MNFGHYLWPGTLVNKVVWRLASRFPSQYERRWAWMFPARYLYLRIERDQAGAQDVMRPRVLHLVPPCSAKVGYSAGPSGMLLTRRHMADQTSTWLVTFADAPARSDIGRLNVRVLGPAWRDRGQRNPTPRGLTRVFVFVYLDRSISMGFR